MSLLVNALLQASFYRDRGAEALGDIPGRFRVWNLGPGSFPYVNGQVEYPVVIGYLSYLVALVFRTATEFFVANGVMIALLAVLMTAMMRVPASSQIWRWVLGAPLLLFAFHNWDLWAMVPAIIGLYAYSSGRDSLSGGVLAFGASAKVFPGLFLPPLIVMRWCSGDRSGAARMTIWAVIVTVLLNGPLAVVNESGWRLPATFQGERVATWGSLWYWLFRLPGIQGLVDRDPAEIANLLSIVALGASLVAISVLAVRRRLEPIAVGAAVTAAFLLTNKVYSPNYDIWIVPFFALLPASRRHWFMFCVADVAIFALVYGAFHGFWGEGTVKLCLWIFVVVRASALLVLISVALRPLEHDTDDIASVPQSKRPATE